MNDNGVRDEYSDERLDEILVQMDDWLDSFSQSAYFETLTEDQQRETEFVVMTFAELMYGYELLPPEAWDVESLELICTSIYPAKVSADTDHFRAVGPVLSAFFAFLADQDELENASSLGTRVQELEDEVVVKASDPENWGMAKSMLMDAADATGTPLENLETLDEIEAAFEAAGVEKLEVPEPESDPSTLDEEREQQFLELYGRLLVYVNDRFDVIEEIETYEEFERRFTDELVPIRDTLYEEDTEAIISEFVEENPANLSDTELAHVEEWTDYEHGDFAVVEHREADTVFLDPEEPRAFGVKSLHFPFSEYLPKEELPLPVADVVLLPFDDVIVSDGWLRHDLMGSMVWQAMGTDIDAAHEEAKHRFGIVESLPPADDPEKSDAEQLRFFTKNKRNRERYADEIAKLKDQSEELARIYHQQLGKARARSLGRTFRELELEEAYVAIYDEQVVATAPTEAKLRETLEAIMPDGREDHPYIYHYDP